MKVSKHKIAAALALFIGVMSVIAGSRVLLSINVPDYNVLHWLVIYNVAAGVVSIAVAILIWQKSKLSIASSILVVAAHALVLILLITVFSEVAATDSMKAMIFRTTIWTAISVLVFKAKKDEI